MSPITQMKNTDYSDERYMRICLELAKRGIGRVSPNPMVGCVIVKENKIIGRGYHRYFGGPHAEIEALNKVKGQTKDATMYVNLEPCVHWGKTPPCVLEIVKTGIKRVVIAMKDPNPLVNGKGISQLRVSAKGGSASGGKGVKCKVGILKKEAKELNRFYTKFITKRTPYVILKSAMSLDGKIATSTGESKWITSPEARTCGHHLRSQIDAVMVGVNTILKDNPSLSAHGKGQDPKKIVIDPELRTPLKAKILNPGNETIIICKENPKKNTYLFTSRGIKILPLPARKGKINFRRIMQELGKMSIASLLIEGGGETNASALQAGVVDEVMFFIAPKIIGGRSALTPVEGEGIKTLKKVLKIEKLQMEKIGSDLLLKGKISSA